LRCWIEGPPAIGGGSPCIAVTVLPDAGPALGADLAIDYSSTDPIEVALEVTSGAGVDVATVVST
jgi:NADPH:quinone reductase-like Zn-dependent oxidoreductase